jgi:hypothetical protein
MSLIFGKLTIRSVFTCNYSKRTSLLTPLSVFSFVNFGIYSAAVRGPNPSPSDVQNFEAARAAFKSTAALDAAYLTAIGSSSFHYVCNFSR